MDLLTYLRRFEPEELVHIGGDTYATRTHDSLKISNGKWCWWSRGIGGTTALDYLTRVEGLSFLDAVQRILGELPHVPPKSEPTAPLPKTEFTLPPKHADNRRVFAYLRSRGIDAEIINHCIKHGQLYEDAERHNCVMNMEPLLTAHCAGRFQKLSSPVKYLAATNVFPLPFPFAPVAKPSACLNPP